MGYLDRHIVFQSDNLEDVRPAVARDIGPHRLELIGKAQEVQASVAAAPLDELALLHATFGPVKMRFDRLEEPREVFHFCLPTRGGGEFRQGNDNLSVSPQHAMMRDLRQSFGGMQTNFDILAVTVPQARLRGLVEALYGPGAALADLRFAPNPDLGGPAGRHLRATLHYLAGQLNEAEAGGLDSLTAAAWEELLLTQMLTALPHSLEDLAAQTSRGGALPYNVKRARDFIHDHAGEKLSLADLAMAAGCSLRSLQASFAETTGLTPFAYLRAVRLERAHADLRAAEPGSTTVAAIARRWGFGDPGRFAGDYRRRYGQPPSETLRKLS